MDDQEVSAFSVYSARKKPKELKRKLKQKLKKRKRLHENSIMNCVVDVVESSTPGSTPEKKRKKINEKILKKTLLKEKDGGIFKDCTLTTKVENVFFNENGFSDKYTSDEQSEGLLNRPKKSKKKKAINGEKQDPEANIFFNKNKVITNNSSQSRDTGNNSNDSSKKNNLKGWLKENTKLPNIIYSDSVKLGEEVLSWLLSPLSVKEFFKNCWEQKPLHIQHNDEHYFESICTLEDFKAALRDHDMYFSKHIDITSYIDGERATENPEGKAKPSVVWDYFKNGRSVRLLNPQSFIPNIQMLNSTLQEFFHCFVGANIYLTPAGTQGFAPHYDDIEAFVLQLEGEKHWRLYNPRSAEEVLPRESSRNFKEDEIGEPILEVTLKPGDLLYFPRGIIHQAKCLPYVHSLHITVSCYQRNSWADLFEKVLPIALQSAISEDVEFRKGLPIGYLNSVGLVYSDHQSSQGEEIKKKFRELFSRILEYCPLDAGVDQLGANYAYDALPPCLSEVEKIYGGGRDCPVDDFRDVLMKCKDKDLGVKLIRATSVRHGRKIWWLCFSKRQAYTYQRNCKNHGYFVEKNILKFEMDLSLIILGNPGWLVSEQEEMLLYYTTDNSLVYHEHDSSSVTVSIQWAQAIDYLIRSYPNFVQMKELPVSNNMNKPDLAARHPISFNPELSKSTEDTYSDLPS